MVVGLSGVASCSTTDHPSYRLLLSQYSWYFQHQRACPDVVPWDNFSWQQGDGAFSVSVSQLPETFHDIQNQVEHHRTRTFQQEYLAFLKRHEHSTHSTRCRLLRAGALSLAQAGLRFDDKYLWDRQRLRPSLRDGPLCIGSQALRAWLLSACPSGTKAIRPSKGLALS